MAYLTYDEYLTYEGREVESADFGRYLYEAERVVDYVTSGVDNVRKLEVAFPTNERDVEAVKRCIASLVTDIAVASEIANTMQAAMLGADGITSGVVQSRSSGSESVSYAALPASALNSGNKAERDKALYGNATYLLRGVQDANGVNLLYGGRYPCAIDTGV